MTQATPIVTFKSMCVFASDVEGILPTRYAFNSPETLIAHNLNLINVHCAQNKCIEYIQNFT